MSTVLPTHAPFGPIVQPALKSSHESLSRATAEFPRDRLAVSAPDSFVRPRPGIDVTSEEPARPTGNSSSATLASLPPGRTPPGLDEIIAILARGVQRAIEAAAAFPRAKSGH
jgi:hypothetical protein